MVAVGKHLCGAATDLSLAAVVASGGMGVAIATCCHHLCSFADYVNVPYLSSLGLRDQADVEAVMALSSWATLNPDATPAAAAADSGAAAAAALLPTEVGTSEAELPLTRAQRIALGYLCKRVLDHGRLLYLEERGFATAFHVYTQDSKENGLLLARI
jgi:tRNA:m4X modification enzyme